MKKREKQANDTPPNTKLSPPLIFVLDCLPNSSNLLWKLPQFLQKPLLFLCSIFLIIEDTSLFFIFKNEICRFFLSLLCILKN